MFFFMFHCDGMKKPTFLSGKSFYETSHLTYGDSSFHWLNVLMMTGCGERMVSEVTVLKLFSFEGFC